MDYSQFDGKKVILTVIDTDAEGGTSTLEGTVDTGNEMGVMFKPKGKSSIDLIMADNIQNVELAPDTPKKLQVKALQPLKESQARQHLVDRHGYKIADIEPLSDAEALRFHNEDVSHEGLAHNHEGKAKDDEKGNGKGKRRGEDDEPEGDDAE